jgi:hypothetical protein
MYPESIIASLSNLGHQELAVIDSVAKTFDLEIAPLSAATGINACQLLLCQLSGVSLVRNHGGVGINKYLPRAWTYGSYIARYPESFCSVAVAVAMRVDQRSSNSFRAVCRAGSIARPSIAVAK